MDSAGFQFKLAATFRQVRCTAAIDFHGTIFGRYLQDIAHKLRQNAFKVRTAYRRIFPAVLFDDIAVPFERIGFVTQVQAERITLFLRFHVRQQARRTPRRGNYQARGAQIKRTRMPDAFSTKDPFQREKGLERCFAGNFVQQDESRRSQLEFPFLLQLGEDFLDVHRMFQVLVQHELQFGNLAYLETCPTRRG